MLSTIFLKISLMLFYRQFVWKQWQRRAIVVAGGCSIILSLIALFLSLFQCGTLKHIAHRQINGHCVRRDRFVPLLYLHGATGAVTDWAFALLPVTVLIKSSLKPHIKLSVASAPRTFMASGSILPFSTLRLPLLSTIIRLRRSCWLSRNSVLASRLPVWPVYNHYFDTLYTKCATGFICGSRTIQMLLLEQ
jgi:hypothetical protein